MINREYLAEQLYEAYRQDREAFPKWKDLKEVHVLNNRYEAWLAVADRAMQMLCDESIEGK